MRVRLYIHSKLYIFWLLHQTTTEFLSTIMLHRCISFDSYIKPQRSVLMLVPYIVVYLLTPTSNHNGPRTRPSSTLLYIFWLLHQTTTSGWRVPSDCWLYIFWLLHQTTTGSPRMSDIWSCISFDSYIKPQLSEHRIERNGGCISFDSYIKPQLAPAILISPRVVYLLTPTSNHNWHACWLFSFRLYIFWLLHQTTTARMLNSNWTSLYIFWLLHQTTTRFRERDSERGCISFDSYIKPQLIVFNNELIDVVYLLTPTSNHNSTYYRWYNADVVYLLTPTSNHNLYSSFPRERNVVYLLTPTSNHNW